jgi:bifunctional UDP-N-acetylglucosamine pyrophosphorylase/glucosamine-1-phosphate N-acetyltransferase
MSTTSIIIIAAGQSSRMNSNIPKVMHLVAERPALAYLLETASATNPSNIILVTAPSMDNVRQFADMECNNIIHAIQENPLGTADAVKAALPFIDNDGRTLILYGDSPFISLNSINNIYKSKKDLLLVGFYTNNPNKYGRLITYDDDLLEIVEFNDANDEQKLLNHCNSGIICIKNKYLHKFIPLIKNKNSKKEFYLTDIIKLATNNDLTCSILNVEEKEVIGINTREDLSVAQNIVQQKIKSKLMNQGVTIINPETSYIAHDFEAGNDVTIYPNVFIGSGVKIGDNVIIRSFSHIEGAIIENDVNIGPFARIRATTYIAQKAKIGNFVEIKNSKIDHSSKINHLSYIGDSEIGYETNIGAGSITCNFDGIQTKSKTYIGNQVAIGSNSSLIAPLKIADRAFIAAGSVITNNVEEDDLAIERSKQVNLSKRAKALRNGC